MYNKLIEYLKSYKKKTIKLSELEKLPDGSMDYEKFESSIKKLVEDNILIEKGSKINSLVLSYGVNNYKLQKDKIDEINNYMKTKNSEMKMELKIRKKLKSLLTNGFNQNSYFQL